MTINDSAAAGSRPEAELAQILGTWVETLARDALEVAELSEQCPERSETRPLLRGGLRHLLHIAPLSEGIEALAMLEVAIMLRVTALLAPPSEHLNNPALLRLRADTALIEQLFPGQREVIWQFCATLAEAERAESEGAPSDLELPEVQDAVADESAVRTQDGVSDDGAAHQTTAEIGEEPTASSDVMEPTLASASAASAAPPELVRHVRLWAEGYAAPAFGAKPHDLTRAQSFVKTRVDAWRRA